MSTAPTPVQDAPAPPVHDRGTPLLEMRGVSKTFPGVKALNEVSLEAWGGEVLSLMGENGAGKSTLMKVLSGAYRADPGSQILIDGKPVEMTDPRVAKAHGIAIIYQELSLAPNLTVAENIYLGNEPRKGSFVDRAAMTEGCRGVLERLGAPFEPETVVGTLSIAEQQLVEIARALHAQARLLVLDEPTTPLSSRETDRLFALVRKLRADGVAIIYISHRMAEIYELSDRVAVLRDGGYVGTLEKGQINAEALVKMMVGRDLSSASTRSRSASNRTPSTATSCSKCADITGDGRRVRKPCSFDGPPGRGPGAGRSGRRGPHRDGPHARLRRRPAHDAARSGSPASRSRSARRCRTRSMSASSI